MFELLLVFVVAFSCVVTCVRMSCIDTLPKLVIALRDIMSVVGDVASRDVWQELAVLSIEGGAVGVCIVILAVHEAT
jgi:hypothetical protein